jgi:UPF0755 protein
VLKRIFLGCGIAVLVVVGCYYVIDKKVTDYLSQSLNLNEKQLVTVKQGDSLRSTLKWFEKNHWLEPSIAAHLVYRFRPELAKIKVGTYQVRPGEKLTSVLIRITSGEEYQFTITFVEGSRFKNWLKKLAADKHLKHEIQGMTEADIARRLSIPRKKLEGLFLAETYHYTQGTSDLDILRRAHQKLAQVLRHSWKNRQAGLPFKTSYEALILASIIEKETALEHERKKIASVFVNRLHKRMRLQTDPTVIYGMGDRYDGNIRKKDLLTPTPYNTYVIRGLPPTPIAMVGVASIEAALHPDSTDYLYFVANGYGGHVFSKSLAEHNRAVRNYLKSLRKK